jgi:CubicO group peptidase (beta-lactamase class C family)
MNPYLSVLFTLGLASVCQAGISPVAQAIQSAVDHQVLAGAVTLVSTRERVLDVGAVGYSDMAARRPMTADSLFWIASMTKPITAAAIMLLVDEGRLGLDDPVSKYLPMFLGQQVVEEQTSAQETLRRPRRPITIRNLLSHTSGLTPRTPLEIPHVDRLSLAENVTSYPMLPLRFEPGSRYEYSNAGFNTAGRIVELVGGMPFDEFLRRRLFGPLGMTDTTFWPSKAQMERLAKSYRLVAGGTGLEEIAIDQLSYPLTDRRRGVCAAGGLFSTAADMGRFCQLILGGGVYQSHRYLAEASVRSMTTTQTGDLITTGGRDFGYGLGWQTFRRDHLEAAATAGSFQHGGAYNTLMRIDPAQGRIGILMVSNQHLAVAAQDQIWSAFYTAVHAYPAR